MAFAKAWTITASLTGDIPAVVEGIRRAFYAHVGTDTDISRAIPAAPRY
jgi:hypothetical protein